MQMIHAGARELRGVILPRELVEGAPAGGDHLGDHLGDLGEGVADVLLLEDEGPG